MAYQHQPKKSAAFDIDEKDAKKLDRQFLRLRKKISQFKREYRLTRTGRLRQQKRDESVE